MKTNKRSVIFIDGNNFYYYDVHGQCDGVRDGITGIIAKDNTPNGLAVAIVEMLSDKGRYEQMRQKAYTWSKEINFNKSYQELKAILKIC